MFRKIISTRLQRSSVCEPNGILGSLSKMLTSKEKVCEKCVLLEHDSCVSYLLWYEAGGRMRWSEINGRKRFPSCLLASVLTVQIAPFIGGCCTLIVCRGERKRHGEHLKVFVCTNAYYFRPRSINRKYEGSTFSRLH